MHKCKVLSPALLLQVVNCYLTPPNSVVIIFPRTFSWVLIVFWLFNLHPGANSAISLSHLVTSLWFVWERVITPRSWAILTYCVIKDVWTHLGRMCSFIWDDFVWFQILDDRNQLTLGHVMPAKVWTSQLFIVRSLATKLKNVLSVLVLD